MLDPRKTTLPATWATDFALALRTREVTGAAIGAALREVESHCADCGQSPQEVFGDAAAYADSLTHLPRLPAASHRWRLLRGLIPSAIGLAGMFVAVDAATAWRTSASVSLQWGTVVGIGVVLAGVAVLVGWPQLLRRRVAVALVCAATMAGAVLAVVQLTATIAHLSALVAGLVGAAAVLGSSWWQHHTLQADPQDDLIADPLDPRPARLPAGGVIALVWFLPLATLALAAIGMLMPSS